MDYNRYWEDVVDFLSQPLAESSRHRAKTERYTVTNTKPSLPSSGFPSPQDGEFSRERRKAGVGLEPVHGGGGKTGCNWV